MSYFQLIIVLLFVYILSEEITFPTFAGPWNEEPVVVKSDIVAAKLVLTIAVHLLGPGPLQEVLVVVSGRGGLPCDNYSQGDQLEID